MGTFLALGLLVAICGFIAYMGDLLGRRLGKRRLTLWGLRPRHTAVLCTVLTGMLIAVFSFAVLMGLSEGIRRAVLHGEALLWENRALRADNTRRTRLQEELTHQILEQREQNERLIATELRLKERVEALRRDLAKREARNAELEKERSGLEARVARLEKSRADLEHGQQILSARNVTLRRANEEQKRQLEGAQQQYRAAKAGLERTRRALRTARDELTRLIREAGEKVASLRERERALADERIIARANEELARAPIEEGADRRAIRDTVESLIRRAESELRHRHQLAGVKPAARLLVWQPRWAAPSDIINTLVDWIETRGEPVVLRAVVDENAASGSTIPMRLATAPRRLAFRRGEEIAAVSLDGRRSEGELLRELVAFLQNAVRQRALKRSVLPAGDGWVGEVHYDPLLETIKRIREVGGPARVGAVAAEEIRSEGPLRVDFRVVPWESRLVDDR